MKYCLIHNYINVYFLNSWQNIQTHIQLLNRTDTYILLARTVYKTRFSRRVYK
jgi:hypothetical protein